MEKALNEMQFSGATLVPLQTGHALERRGLAKEISKGRKRHQGGGCFPEYEMELTKKGIEYLEK